MRNYTDHTGQRFGNLTAIKYAGRKYAQQKPCWLCRCDCGKEIIVAGSHLRRGQKSCGCLNAQIYKASNSTHGLTKSSEFRIWQGIKNRCLNPRVPSYPRYGGRGITIDPKWATSFVAFYDHVGPRPSTKHTIDRIDNDTGYAPGNVRWAAPRVQQNNKSTTRKVLSVPLQEMARSVGLAPETIARRIEKGMHPVDAITRPLDPTKIPIVLTMNGETKPLMTWASELGFTPHMIRRRLKRGWSIEEALTQTSRRAIHDHAI